MADDKSNFRDRVRVSSDEDYEGPLLCQLATNYAGIGPGTDLRAIARADLTPEQSKAARALLNWSRVRLGAKANLSEMPISDFENGFRKPYPHTIAAVRQALEDAGIVFTVEGCPSLARSEGPISGPRSDNRMWRRRETEQREKPPTLLADR